MMDIRLVVRNTGHDFFGRSTGAGALAIWTHHLDSIDFVPWSDSYFRGTAMKIGAGVMGYQAARAAEAAARVVVTGECPTVGLAGFTMGAGHSALSTSFGIGPDQVLAYEVVTSSGFLAPSGGGPGTYGVVVSMTVKTYPAFKVGGGTLQLAAAYTTQDKFNQAVAALHALLPGMTDLGADVIYVATNQALHINPVTVYNSTGDYVQNTVLAPFIAKLNDLGIPFATKYTTLSYLDHYDTYMGPLPNGNMAVETYYSADYRAPTGAAANALQLITLWNSSSAAWPAMLAEHQRITNELVPQIEAVTPGSAAYVNEADFNQPDWKTAFFGANYDKLLAIKKRWDPTSLFYVLKGVGSDAWTVGPDGRMCRA
ncbi:putative isoamyl alcohol protein [Staphylotrichum tortipilum]|uniref:Isoamyl alcohol protein n=1 Tax=Staphylotrichum tortipilum TaxID=2831512 RepID=A0AAN6RNH9_9PEZI|nr:putative isoamyl alcohol protein [Staphylotrichum longicolle]